MNDFLLGALKLALGLFLLIWILGLSFVIVVFAKAFFLSLLRDWPRGRHKPDKHIM